MADVPLMNNPMTTAGDVLYGGASGAPTRLAVGTAGQVLTVNAGATAPEWAAAGAGADEITVVRKTADETVNNSSTLQNDDHLLLAIGANEVWEFEVNLWWIANSSADLKVAFTVPAAATLRWANTGTNTSSVAYNETPVQGTSGTAFAFEASTGSDRHTRFVGYVANGANAGNLQVQWAQNSTHLSDLTVYANSTLRAWQLA